MDEETCGSELHDLYPHCCPECNPEDYALMVAQAPEGKVEETPLDAGEGPSIHTTGYSDRY